MSHPLRSESFSLEFPRSGATRVAFVSRKTCASAVAKIPISHFVPVHFGYEHASGAGLLLIEHGIIGAVPIWDHGPINVSGLRRNFLVQPSADHLLSVPLIYWSSGGDTQVLLVPL